MPVLDAHKVKTAQLKALAAGYDRVACETLKPLSEMESDSVHAEIDRTIAAVLRLPDFSALRSLLAREPVVCLRRL